MSTVSAPRRTDLLLSVVPRWDIALFLLSAALLAVSFEQGFDMSHTIGASIGYLNGHFLDLYDIAAAQLGYAPNYLPSTYIVFAIWAVPLRLLGHLQEVAYAGLSFLWFKGLTTLVYFGSAIVLYRIGRELRLSERGAVLVAVAWVSTPLAVFSQFIFGQYDILTVLPMLIGFLFYLRRRYRLAALLFGIAVTFKYFPLLLFVPLILLAEKRLKELVIAGALLVGPALIEILVYLPSAGFREGVFGFEATTRVLDLTFQVDATHGFPILLVAWLVLCGWAYLHDVPDANRLPMLALDLSVSILALTFALIYWHPQWLLMLTPFLVLRALLTTRRAFFLTLDVLMMVPFVAFVVRNWPGGIDQLLFQKGVLNTLDPHLLDRAFTMQELLPFSLGSPAIWLGLFTAVLLVSGFAWLWRPGEVDTTIETEPSLLWWLRARFVLGVLIFVVPAVLALGFG